VCVTTLPARRLAQQVSEGDNKAERPMWAEKGGLDFEGRARWDAWTQRKGLAPDKAKAEFVRVTLCTRPCTHPKLCADSHRNDNMMRKPSLGRAPTGSIPCSSPVLLRCEHFEVASWQWQRRAPVGMLSSAMLS
jgi:acyl-CoA-binding protein